MTNQQVESFITILYTCLKDLHKNKKTNNQSDRNGWFTNINSIKSHISLADNFSVIPI